MSDEPTDLAEVFRKAFAHRLARMHDGTMAAKIQAMREANFPWKRPVAGTDPDAPPIIPDWGRFIAACRQDLAAATYDTPLSRPLAGLLDGAREQLLQRLCRRLSSRHLPLSHTDAVPGLPWSAIKRWAALTDRVAYDPEMPAIPSAVVAGWAATEAAAWLPHMDTLETWLMTDGGRPSGNDHSPVLWTNGLGESGWTELAARVPATAMPAIRAAIAAATAGSPPPPTADAVREILGSPEITERLTDLGVQTLWVYGSVAAGTAGPGSDVDVLTTMRAPALGRWNDVAEVLEAALKRPIDLHVTRTDEQANDLLRSRMAVMVWEVAAG